VIARFRDVRPDIALSSDFIIGFPGETDEDFEATYTLVEKTGYATSYSFKFSARPGTPAANMQGLVREDVKDARLQRLQSLISAQSLAYNQSFIGKTIPVLFDGAETKDGQVHGRTEYNHSIHVKAPKRLIGHIVDVNVTSAGQMALHGEVKLEQNEAA